MEQYLYECSNITHVTHARYQLVFQILFFKFKYKKYRPIGINGNC